METLRKHIVVSGIGAIGGYYGGLLANLSSSLESVKVSFFMREGEHLNKVKEEGLHIQTPTLDIRAQAFCATHKAEELDTADFLFLATKSYHLEENIQQLLPSISSQTVIIPLLNGLDIAPRIRKVLPNNVILPAVCHITARRYVGEIIVRSDENMLHFGGDLSINSSLSTEDYFNAEYLYLLLKAAGVKCRYFPDVRRRIREKFLMLSPSALATAYFDTAIGEVMDLHKEEFEELVAELSALYYAKGWSEEHNLEERAIYLVQKMPREATTSMHSDIKAAHISEIESLVAYPLSLAKEVGIKMPLYEKMYSFLKNKIDTQA